MTLIRLYKKYKLELEIINDPNKKLCPYPNCDSFLEKIDDHNKEAKCKNNHSFCFLCLKKPHANFSCNENIDKSIVDFARNHFVKKCPNCGIIIEKNNGCNHITCVKCGHQWCWLCNEKYDSNHFQNGKCKGFQFFQPKDNYEIKLMMEGKIKYNQLSESQRQLNIINEYNVNLERRGRRLAQADDNYNQISCKTKIKHSAFFLLFGNWYFIPEGFRILKSNFGYRITYTLLFLSLFFPMIYLNIITFLFILFFFGFRTFILEFQHLEELYVKQFTIIFVNVSILISNLLSPLWNFARDSPCFIDNFIYEIILFFSCYIFRIIIFQNLVWNSILILVVYIISDDFSSFISDLDDEFNKAFGYRIERL